MPLNPLKVFLFVAGGTVAAAAVAFYAGGWRNETAAPEQAALSGNAVSPAMSGAAAPADPQTAPGKQPKPEQQAALDQAAPSAAEKAPAEAASPAVAGKSPLQNVQTAPDPAVPSQPNAETPSPDVANAEPSLGGLDVSTPDVAAREPAPDAATAQGTETQALASASAEPSALASNSPLAPAASQDSSSRPASSQATKQSEPATATSQTPTFDIVRVEPNGSAVVAGRAAPEAKVDLMLGGKVLASTTAGAGGDFAIVLDEPLKPGDHQIQLKGTGRDGATTASKQTALVSVPENKDGQVLAMVEEPGAASRVLTTPEAPAVPAKAQEGSSAATPLPAAGAGAQAGGSAATQQSEKPSIAGNNNTPAKPSPDTGTQVATAGNGDGALEQSAPATVSVQAVEIEGRRIYVAGLAAPGSSVRVYADDVILGDARASTSGEFLVEATRDLSVGDHTIRVDELKDDGTVLARAAVPFEREAGEKIAAVATDVDGVAPSAAAPVTDADAPTSDTAVQSRTADSILNPGGAEVPTSGSSASAGVSEDSASAPTPVAPSPQARTAANPDPTTANAEDSAAAAATASSDSGARPAEQSATGLSDAPASQSDDVAAVSSGPTSAASGSGNAAEGPTVAAPSVTVPSAPEAGTATASGSKEGSVSEPGSRESAIVDVNNLAGSADVMSSNAQTASDGTDRPAAAGSAPPKSSEDGPANAQGTATALQEKQQPPSAAGSATSPSATGMSSDVPSAGDQIAAVETAPVTNAPKLHNVQGAVIIRRGDSLWRISRRVYGYGTRYSTIYLANRDQIQNPDLIMPGQVFSVPDRSQQGEAADMNALGDQKASRME